MPTSVQSEISNFGRANPEHRPYFRTITIFCQSVTGHFSSENFVILSFISEHGQQQRISDPPPRFKQCQFTPHPFCCYFCNKPPRVFVLHFCAKVWKLVILLSAEKPWQCLSDFQRIHHQKNIKEKHKTN